MGVEKKVEKIESRIAFAAGEIHALKVVLGTLITLSPARRQMATAFDTVEDVVLSQALSVPVAEDYLDGARLILNEVRRALDISPE